MDRFYQNLNVQFLIDKYFDDPKRRVRISKGEILFKKDDENERLYIVLEGSLIGYLINPDNTHFKMYTAGKGMFVGVHSFFSGIYSSPAHVEAEVDSLLAFIDKNHPNVANLENPEFIREFMPVIIGELLYRQQLAHKIYLGREQALKELLTNEKMASLGQMAASIAHELNNSIAVLKRNSEWLQQMFDDMINENSHENYEYFKKGLSEGRVISSSKIRKTSKVISERLQMPLNTAKKLAQAGFDAESIDKIKNKSQQEIYELIKMWEIGSSFNDMKTASYHSSHIVKSVKQLGAQQAHRDQKVDINEAVNESLILLKGNLKSVNLEIRLNPVPEIPGDLGEFVQIFSNLIKNACESLIQAETLSPLIEIFSSFVENKIIVHIIDNGPGIPEDIRPRIFQPNVTTKVSGLSFGLGIGLSIVEKLIKSYNGSINVESKPGKTDFEIIVPRGE